MIYNEKLEDAHDENAHKISKRSRDLKMILVMFENVDGRGLP